MKLTKTIMACTIAAAAVSCSNPLEDQLLGDWVLGKYEIAKLDSICNAKAQEAREATQKAIDLAKHEIDSAKTPALRKQLQENQNQLQEQLAAYTPQKYKDDYTQMGDRQIGKMTISFQNNKIIQVQMEDSNEKQSGTWRVSNDTVFTLFDNQPSEILIVKNISSSSLTLFSPALDEHSLDLTLKFNKK